MNDAGHGSILLVCGERDCVEESLVRRGEVGPFRIEFLSTSEDPAPRILSGGVAAFAIDLRFPRGNDGDFLALLRSHELSVRRSGAPAILVADGCDAARRSLAFARGFMACVPWPANAESLLGALLRARELRAQTRRHCRSEDHDDILGHLLATLDDVAPDGRGKALAALHLAIGSSLRDALRSMCAACFEGDGARAAREAGQLSEVALGMGAFHLAQLARGVAGSLRDGARDEFERSVVVACAEIDRIGFSLGERMVEGFGQASTGD